MTLPRSPTLRASLAVSVAIVALAPVLGAAPALAQAIAAPGNPSPAVGATGFAQIMPNGFASALGNLASPAPIAGTQLAQISANPTLSVAAPLPGIAAPTQAESVVVTGSRLRTSNLTSEAPITVVTAKQIEQSSSQTIEDVLRKIPSIGTDGVFSTTNNGGNGASCIDLRNLGYTRTLVLVDGRRFVHTPFGGGSDCVDLDTIPIQLVDRIEILKDGASSIYGADAVAGVINVITKKNYSGAQINLGGNITASGDDTQGEISGIFGHDFAQGRGNITVSGRYLDRGPVYQKDRDFATPVVSSQGGPGAPFVLGSAIPEAGRFFGQTSGSGNTVINGQLVPFQNRYNGANSGNPNINGRYDFAYDQQLSDRETQGNLAGEAHFDVNDHLTAYASVFYTHKNTEEQLSGQPITGNPNTGESFVIPQGNPFAEALGINEGVSSFRRTTDFGPRFTTTGSDTWQATVGARGLITGNWNYDAYFTYGYSATTIQLNNQINFANLENAVGFQQVAGAPAGTGIFNPAVCSPAQGCALFNPFGANNFTPQSQRYVSFQASSNAFYQFRDFGATVTNDKLVRLPYGPVGLALGFEHRGEQGAYHPDPTIQAGLSTAAAEAPTGGGFNVSEVFGELHVPILKDLIGAKDLSTDVSGRWSDYNTFGAVQNFQVGLNWTPVRDIRFRANLGTSVRQPAISEAFGGQTLSFEQGTDPCTQISSYGGLAGIVAANCARQRLPAGYTQNGSQIPTLVGGNPNLLPESSRTYTIGTVITPRWLPNFAATVDYFHTSIANQISAVPVQFIEDQCYTSVNESSPQCANAGTRNATGNIQLASGLNQNLGVLRTNGIDFDLNYLIKLRGGNNLSFTNELIDTIGYTLQEVPDGPFINLKGRLTPLLTGLSPAGVPVIRDNFTGTYGHGPFSFSWTVRYIDGMTYNQGGTDFTSANRFYKTNEVFYHDIVATYNFKKVLVVAGIDNLFDRTPPFALDAATNTAPQVYDVLGRLFYARLQVRF